MAILAVIVCALIFILFISCEEMPFVGVNAAYTNRLDTISWLFIHYHNQYQTPKLV